MGTCWSRKRPSCNSETTDTTSYFPNSLHTARSLSPSQSPSPPDITDSLAAPHSIDGDWDSTNDHINDILNLVSDLQSERMDSQRAELPPIEKSPKVSKATSLPGLRPLQTTSTRPEDDFMEIIARVQGSRLDDQRSELPAPKRKVRPELDDDFITQLMRAQSGRMEDQRASIPVKESPNKATNSKK